LVGATAYSLLTRRVAAAALMAQSLRHCRDRWPKPTSTQTDKCTANLWKRIDFQVNIIRTKATIINAA